jgi:methylmalonyl-CoA/ethylmalonyl-CoA epimerase
MKLEKIHQVAAYARDLDEAIGFYKDTLGARFIAKYDPPGLLFFDFSGVRLLLEEGVTKSTLYFRVDDIESAYEELKSKGIEFTDEPHLIFRDDTGIFGEPNEEEWMVFFTDPSGNVLALASRKPVQES